MLNSQKLTFSDSEKCSLDYSSVDLTDVNRVVGMPKVVSKLVNGRIVTSVEFVCTPIEEINAGLTVDDFALENLLANGVKLSRVDFKSLSLSDIDSVSSAVEALKSSTDSANIHKVELQKS